MYRYKSLFYIFLLCIDLYIIICVITMLLVATLLGLAVGNFEICTTKGNDYGTKRLQVIAVRAKKEVLHEPVQIAEGYLQELHYIFIYNYIN